MTQEEIQAICDQIQEVYQTRLDFLGDRIAVSNRLFARRRRVHARTCDKKSHLKCEIPELSDDGYLFLSKTLDNFHKDESGEVKTLEALAKRLPVWGWAECVRGVGPLSVAQIVGECGNLSNYANPAKVWKRMGLCPGDKRIRGVKNGYSPRRRSVMWNIGSCMIKSRGEYKDLYDRRKEYERTKGACMAPLKDGKGICKKDDRCKDGHVHRRTQRWMEKAFLKHLWNAWHGKSA